MSEGISHIGVSSLSNPLPQITKECAALIAEVRPYSMVPDDGLAATISLTLQAIEANVPGVLVECGTWLGGASFAMLLAQQHVYGKILRPVWMYDSFKGMSKPVEQDGDGAARWYERAQSGEPDPDHQNYCVAPLDRVKEAIQHFGFGQHAVVHEGWFHETLPRSKPLQIAVLRVDCDWYEPCMQVYEALVPRVSEGGAIIIDDYYVWEGCMLATHEYLASHKLPWPIKTVPNMCGSWMRKGEETW